MTVTAVCHTVEGKQTYLIPLANRFLTANIKLTEKKANLIFFYQLVFLKIFCHQKQISFEAKPFEN